MILTTISDTELKNLTAMAGNFFFAQNTMSFFKSRLGSLIFKLSEDNSDENGHYYFFTSERKSFSDTTRVFTVRKMTVTWVKRVSDDRSVLNCFHETISEFGQFDNATKAKRFLKYTVEALLKSAQVGKKC